MVRNCCVSTCGTVWNPYDEISLFSFPWKNDAVLKEWKKVIPTNCKITTNSRICSLHFQIDLVEQKFGKRILKKDAIPTIFAEEKRTLQGQDKASQSDTIGLLSNSATELQTENRQGIQSVSRDESMEIEDCEDRVEPNYAPLKTKQMKSVGTQVSPKRLKPSTRELELQRKIKVLRDQLRRRDKKLVTISQLMKELKQSGTSSDAPEEVLTSSRDC